MPETVLIAFDRALAGAVLPGQGSRFLSESELAARSQDAFRRGVDSARALADQQMVEFRADVSALSEGVLKKIAGLEGTLMAQLAAALPGLGMEIARRLLAGYEPPAEVVARLCGDRTAQLLGRLSLNPMRHIAPIGTLVVPGVLLAIGGPLIGWAKPVPVATRTLRHPRRALVCVALAGPLANFAMAAIWCGILAAMAHLNTVNATVVAWRSTMQ